MKERKKFYAIDVHVIRDNKKIATLRWHDDNLGYLSSVNATLTHLRRTVSGLRRMGFGRIRPSKR